jgi:hypothetical protein
MDERQVMAYLLGNIATLADVSGRQMTARIAFDMPDDADVSQ